MKKTYYIADSEYSDAIYGDQLPVCIDRAEVERLAREWDMDMDELLEQMHEATEDDIDEFGVYGSASTGDPLIDNGPYIEADICAPEYEVIDQVRAHRRWSSRSCEGYLVRMDGVLFFVENPAPRHDLPKLPVLWSAIERDWPFEEVCKDECEDGYWTFFGSSGSIFDPFKED